MEISVKSAEREFNALNRLFRGGMPVPEPIARNRHVIVMSEIDGAPLNEIWYVENAEELLEEILKAVKTAYKLGIVHSELSEYNILVNNMGRFVIIDWPQYIEASNEESKQFLMADLKRIIFFFKKRFNVYVEIQDALSYVLK